MVRVLPGGSRYATREYQRQVTIPQGLREKYHIEPETELEFEDRGDGTLIRPVKGDRKRIARERVGRMMGSATHKDLTTDEIMALMRDDD